MRTTISESDTTESSGLLMNLHDRVLTYGDTYKATEKPLILIVGREPSFDADRITDTVGVYDFDRVQSASFWDVAHRYVASAIGIDRNEFKQMCRDHNCSPLIIGDALPIGVENGNPDVSVSRGSVSEEDIDFHVKRTLDLSQAKDRVKLIVLAGHISGDTGNKQATQKLAYANESFRRQALEVAKNALVIDIPFLTDQNSHSLQEALSKDETSAVISEIVNKFFP